MHRVRRGRTMYLFLILLYFTAQLTGISIAGDVCSHVDLTATSDLKTIFSPNFPSSYPNDVHCITRITSPENTVIELTFDSFQLEYSEDCNKDFLSIIDRASVRLLYPNCGIRFAWPHYPDKIVSRSNDMMVTFATDDQIRDRGFNATFRAVQPSEHIFIFAESSIIRVVPRFNDANFRVTPVEIVDPLAVDYDPRTQYVYYSDRGAKMIGRIHLEFSHLQSVLHSEYILEPFGLRIDVNSRLLYWTDAELGTISVSNLDGEYRNTIINTDLDKPGAMVTESYEGYIYFTDWGTNPKIERADGDGRNRVVLVNSHIVSPRSVAIDLKERTLYWIDAVQNSLERVNYDGTNRRVVKVVSPANVFSLVLDDYAFFYNGNSSSDPSNGYIHFFERKLQSDESDVRWGLGKYYKGLSLRPRYESEIDVLDTCPKADCNGLCLPKPNGEHTCLKDDTTPPVFLNCPDTIYIWIAPGASSSLVSWDDILLRDDVDIILSSSRMSGSVFYLGTETVAIAARDFVGNIAWCNFSVTVIEDNVPPVILLCPDDISVTLISSVENEQIVKWTEPELSDNAGEADWIVRPVSSGTGFPIGSTPIIYVASDQFGNTAQCSFLVTVTADAKQTSAMDEEEQHNSTSVHLVVGVGSSLGLVGLVAAILISVVVCKSCKNTDSRNNKKIVGNSASTEANFNEHYVPDPTHMMNSSNRGMLTAQAISGGSVQYNKPETEPYYMDPIDVEEMYIEVVE